MEALNKIGKYVSYKLLVSSKGDVFKSLKNNAAGRSKRRCDRPNIRYFVADQARGFSSKEYNVPV